MKIKECIFSIFVFCASILIGNNQPLQASNSIKPITLQKSQTSIQAKAAELESKIEKQLEMLSKSYRFHDIDKLDSLLEEWAESNLPSTKFCLPKNQILLFLFKKEDPDEFDYLLLPKSFENEMKMLSPENINDYSVTYMMSYLNPDCLPCSCMTQEKCREFLRDRYIEAMTAHTTAESSETSANIRWIDFFGWGILRDDPLFGMDIDAACHFYETYSIFNKRYPEDNSLQEKIEAAKPFEDSVVMLWTDDINPNIQQKPMMVSATLIDTDELQLPSVLRGRLLVTCAHFLDKWKDLTDNFIRIQHGALSFPLGAKYGTENKYISVSKLRKSRFIPEDDRYKGIYVEAVYFVPGKDIAFCVLNEALPNSEDEGREAKGLPLSPIEDLQSLVGKKAISVGFGTGTNIGFTVAKHNKDEHNKDTGSIINMDEIEKIDLLHKASGWQKAKLRSGVIDRAQGAIIFTGSCNNGDSGSFLKVSDSGIVGIITRTGYSSTGYGGGFYTFNKKELDAVVQKLTETYGVDIDVGK